MTTALGIHCGHESSCSVVRDGRLVAAIQQERVTRRKYDGQECLSDRLPLQEVLSAAQTTIDDVDIIVSSFQAAGPSGVGLQRPLFSRGFTAFDPFDPRHHVASHHLAHAASAVYLSGLPRAAVLISDSAGTTSWDGADFYQPFKQFFDRYYADSPGGELRTEMRSVYAFADDGFELLDRSFSQPHNQPDIFVQSEASLYDNVARYLFRNEHAHGQLMALAGIPQTGPRRLLADDIVTAGLPPQLKNGWQLFDSDADPADCGDIAAAVQAAFSRLLAFHAQRAVELAGCPDLCCAGGVFLNLTANTEIAGLSGVREFYVPSCPHDAGISAGAAFLGWSRIRHGGEMPGRLRHDFLGRAAQEITSEQAESHGYHVAASPGSTVTSQAAAALVEGAIVARYAGRAEFGPRALGNRSLLCHPVTCADARARLNRLKHRQGWRPVAPMVREQDVETYFIGPRESPFMNFNFVVRTEYRGLLAEAVHADGTARVQTVTRSDNPAMYDLLTQIAERGQPPILINTSLNGPGQPIIESARDAMDFAAHAEVDYLLTEDRLFASPASGSIVVRRPDSVVLAMFGTGAAARYVLSNETASQQVDRPLFLALCDQGQASADGGSRTVLDCLRAGLLVEV